MPKPRRTEADRRRESEAANRDAWDYFSSQLLAAETFKAAALLAASTPKVDGSGRHYYSNLSWFLRTSQPPGGANNEERTLYVGLVRRACTAGEIEKPAMDEIIERFQNSRPDGY